MDQLGSGGPRRGPLVRPPDLWVGVRVRTPDGKEGFAAAWYLEHIPGTAPIPSTGTDAGSDDEPDSSTTAPPTKPSRKMLIYVSASVGAAGLRMRKTASMGGALAKVLAAGTELKVLEPGRKARLKIGKANEWIYVREPEGKRGYVQAEFVQAGP